MDKVKGKPFKRFEGRRFADATDILLTDHVSQVIACIYVRQDRQPTLHIGQELARYVVGFMSRIQCDKTHRTLRVQTRNFIRVDLIVEQHIIEPA